MAEPKRHKDVPKERVLESYPSQRASHSFKRESPTQAHQATDVTKKHTLPVPTPLLSASRMCWLIIDHCML